MPIKLPNWLRIVWWLLLAAGLSLFLYSRLPDLTKGRGAAIDVLAFLILMGLLLVPVFTHVSFFGITLKQQIKDAKDEIKDQLIELKSEVRNTIDVRHNVNVYAPGPPPDAALPDLEVQVKRAVNEQRGAKWPSHTAVDPNAEVPEAARYLFSVRYAIERELRRILDSRIPNYSPRRSLASYQLTSALTNAGLLSPDMAHAIREVLAVCSPAIHAEIVSTAKEHFVADVAPDLIAKLKAIE